MRRGYVVVEGHGETEAVGNLVTRLWADLGLRPLPWAPPMRFPRLAQQVGVRKACSVLRARPNVAALLVLRDSEDVCPREAGPALSRVLADERLPFPAAGTLLYREYETLFLAVADTLAGRPLPGERGGSRPGLLPNARFVGDPEGPRDAKKWLTDHMPAGRAYKPTMDQLPLTRLLDFNALRRSGLPCFGTLERALGHLATQVEAGSCDVYPPTAG